MLATLAALLIVAPPKPEVALRSFLDARDGGYAVQLKRADARGFEAQLTSQQWQGALWKHSLQMLRPETAPSSDVGFLFITGDGPFASDRAIQASLVKRSGLPVAMLYDIPNQPLYGKREDDLIAHTFEQYLRTGDPNWPLLFPMTKAAIRAMDAVVQLTKDSARPIRRFVVTGASKRGWTTWFVGVSGDRRVVGIAPMVYDNLNLGAQMRHQLASWGRYSPMIDDYTRRGLQQQLSTTRGQELSAMVDPFTLRRNLKVPVLSVNGANDPYWATDALGVYWKDIPGRKNVLMVPNAGHDLGGGRMAVETIGAFGALRAQDRSLPGLSARLERSDGKVRVEIRAEGKPFEMRAWIARSRDRFFSDKRWQWFPVENVRGRWRVELPLGDQDVLAVTAEARYRLGDQVFSLSTPVEILGRP